MAYDEKYIVFKRSDFEDLYVSLVDQVLGRLPVVDDAVVIRRQDLFAPSALHVYANSIALAAQVMGANDEDKAVIKRLSHIADYFHEQAVAAEAEAWKLPD